MRRPDIRAIEHDGLPVEAFPEVRQGFRVRIDEEAFDRATARAAEEPDREVGGILVGRLARDGSGPFVLVETTIDALHAEEKSTELTFTHETWAHVHEEMDVRHEGRQIVGWYHSHPGFGVFLSDRDTFIHRSFFDLPHQIALVYDPRSREHGLFVWQDGEPTRSRRYWIGDSEQTWDPEPGEPERHPAETDEDKQEAAREGLPADRLTLAFTALLIFIAGGLAGWWFGPGRAPVEGADRRAKLLAERRAGTREIVDGLNLQVFDVLRRTLDQESRRRLGEVRSVLARGLEAAGSKEEAKREAGLEDLRTGLNMLVELHQAQVGASRTLELVARTGERITDPRQMAGLISRHSAVLGQLCVEQAEDAAKDGDRRRARRLLLLATQVDPAQRERYQERMRQLGEDGK